MTDSAPAAVTPDSPLVHRVPMAQGNVMWALGVWLLGLAITAWLSLTLYDYQRERLTARFDHEVSRAAGDIERRLGLPTYGLMGARGVYAAVEKVNRTEFSRYVASRRLAQEFPGVRGIGFIERVPRASLESFLTGVRADGAPDFSLKTQGNAEDLYVIKYIEPLARNRAALGLDVGSEPLRRAAAERAARTGMPALTDVIPLVQDELSRPGFLLYVPVYHPGRPLDTPDERLAALHGLTYAPMVLEEVLESGQDLLGSSGLRLELTDKPLAAGGRVLYSAGPQAGSGKAALQREQPLMIAGTLMALQARSTPAFEASSNHWLAGTLAASGVVLSSLLALMMWLQTTRRARAEARAQRMTVDLQKLALVAERTANVVLMTDAQMRITWVNEGFTRISGYTPEDALGKTPGELLGSGKSDAATLETLRQSTEQGVACRVEIINRAKDGREYWVDTEVQPIRDATGALTGFIEIGLDITQERETNARLVQALSESEAQQQQLRMLARVARETSNAVILTNVQGHIEWVNEGFTRVSGYTLQEALGQQPGKLLQCPETDPATVDTIRQALAAIQPCEVEILNHAKDGRLYWLELQIQPLFDTDGRHSGFMAIESDITERKQAELAIREGQQRFKGLLDIASDWYWEADEHYRFTHFVATHDANYQTLSQPAMGKARWEIEGMTPLSSDWSAHIAQHERRENFRNFEYQRRLPSGELRFYSVSGFPVFDTFGHFKGYRGTSRDTTDEKHRELRLSQTLHENQALMNAIDQGTIYSVADLQGVITEVNDAFVRISGYTRGELIGSNHRLLKSGEQPVGLWQEAWGTISAGHVWRGDVCNRAKDGTIYWVDSTIVPFIGADGLAEKYISIRTDITANKNAQSQMEAQRQRLDNIIKGTHAGTWEWHVPTGRTLFNERWAQIVGHTLAELEPVSIDTWMRFAHPDELQVSGDALQRHFAGELDYYEVESRMRHKDGHWVWVLACGQLATREADGSPGWMYGTHQDITAQKNAEIALRLSEGRMKALSELSAQWFWETDTELRFTHFTCGDPHLLHQLNNVALGRRRWEMAVEPLHSTWDEHRSVMEKHGSFLDFQYRRADADGTVHYWSASGTPWYNADGEFVGYIGTGADISERKNAEVRLARSEALLERTAHIAQVGAWRVDLATGRPEWSAETCRIHDVPVGYQPTMEEALSFFTPKARPVITEAVTRGMQTGDGWDLELPFITVTGRRIWVRALGQVELQEGQAVALVGALQDITERKEAENDILESQKRFKNLLSVAADWYWETDDQYRFTQFVSTNDSLSSSLSQPTLGPRRWEIPGETALSWNLAEHIAKQDRREVFRNFEYQRTLPNGEIRYFAISGFPFYDSFGHFKGYRGTSRDTTEQKRQETELQTARDRIELATSSAGIGVWVFDVLNNTLEWDERMYMLYGRIPTDLLEPYELWTNSLHPDDMAESVEALEDAMAGKRAFDVEFRIVWPDGSVRYIRGTARVQRNDQGQAVRMVGVNYDITEQRERERIIASEKVRLSAIYDILPVGISITDPQGRIIDCNPASEQLLGITKAEHLARNYDGKEWAINREDGSPMPVEEFASVRALTQGVEVHDEVMQVITDQRSAWLSVSAMPVQHADFGVVIAYVDITQQKAQADALLVAKTQAEQASLFKSQFLANMSHEIRTPMNAILGMLKLLHNTNLQPRQLDYVEKTEGAAKSLLGLLNDILDFSKVEAGKMTLDPQPFGLDRLLRDLSVIFSASVGNKPVEVLFDIDPQLPRQLVGDNLRLQQILINLGGNAIKFTSQGEVVLRVRLEAIDTPDGDGAAPSVARVHFAVKDSGIGIAPENQHKIFAGFTQAEASTTRRFGGTGLGLSICRRLIEVMGGQLQLDSALGQGSTFSFTVPLPLAEAAHVPSPALPAPEAAMSVLVVDDNPVARELMAAMGASMGWSVDVADSGEAALALVQARHEGGEPYRAVFVDLLMPGLDGWQTSAGIRSQVADRDGPHEVPVIMMVTAHGREMLAQQTAEVQALIDGYLVKPVTASMLFDAMQNALHAADTAPTQRSHTQVLRPLSGLRVLLVEDNAINQQVAEELLSGQGALVDIADNGLRGVEAVQAALTAGKPYHAVLMDMQMPVMDGLTAAREIRSRLAVADLPIIAMTANAMASDRDACLDAGMNDHVGKPFDLDRLVATLLQWTRGQAPLEDPTHHPHSGADAADGATPAEPSAAPAAEAMVLNRAGALQRVGGSVSLLDRLSAQFLGDLPALLQACEAARDPQRQAEAQRALHTLKGVAATIGVDALAQAARQAEQACKAGEAIDLGPLQRVAALTRQQLLDLGVPEPAGTQTSDGPAPAPTALPPPSDAQCQLLQRLLPLLEASDMEVFDAMDELLAQGDVSRWVALDGAVQAMEFAQAATLVREALQSAG